MNRKSFIESLGATCNNWTWSWSFINTKGRTIIFGAWDKHTKGSKSLILSEKWKNNREGRKNAAYDQSREHIRLVEKEGYTLFTFPIIFSDKLHDEKGKGPSQIKKFLPTLTLKHLSKEDDGWYAHDAPLVTEEVFTPECFVEGATTTIAVNSHERNRQARSACIKQHGTTCSVCKFHFETTYGMIAKDFIHVHHIVPLSQISEEYEVDPIRDLIPVCPNCHAVIHLTQPPMSIEELRKHLKLPIES